MIDDDGVRRLTDLVEQYGWREVEGALYERLWHLRAVAGARLVAENEE